MKIDEFVKEYSEADKNEKTDLIREHIVNAYIPYLRKVACAEAIVKQTQFDEDGQVRLNTPIRYLVTLTQAVAEYTDLESSGNTDEDFDKLQSCGALANIIDAIKPDFTVYENVVQMQADDVYANETQLTAYMDKTKKEILDMANELLDTISESVENAADNALKSQDNNKVQNKDNVQDSNKPQGETE